MAVGQTPIIKIGTLSTSIGDVYKPNSGLAATIKSITFNNTANSSWTLYVYKKIISPAQTFFLYKQELSAGDIVYDDTPYLLTANVQLQAYASASTINYSIEGYTESA